jgi:hypothetical protein
MTEAEENDFLTSKKKERITLVLSMGVNFFTFVGKIVLACLASSGFLVVSAMVTCFSLLTKLTACLQLFKKSRLTELDSFGLMAINISVGAICYLSYMIRLFFFPKIDAYSIYEGLAIAAFAFVDLGWAIHSLLQERKKHDLVMIGLKCGSLSNGLAALVLAQIAILAFKNPGTDFSFYNGIGGTVFGALDLAIGLTMLICFLKAKNIKKN